MKKKKVSADSSNAIWSLLQSTRNYVKLDFNHISLAKRCQCERYDSNPYFPLFLFFTLSWCDCTHFSGRLSSCSAENIITAASLNFQFSREISKINSLIRNRFHVLCIDFMCASFSLCLATLFDYIIVSINEEWITCENTIRCSDSFSRCANNHVRYVWREPQ